MTTAGQGSINRKTFSEGISQLMGQIGQMMGLPDSDPGFCQALLQACRQWIGQQTPQAVPMGYGAPPPTQGPQPMGVRRDPTVPESAMGPAMAAPNPDEFRRTIGAAQGM